MAAEKNKKRIRKKMQNKKNSIQGRVNKDNQKEGGW